MVNGGTEMITVVEAIRVSDSSGKPSIFQHSSIRASISHKIQSFFSAVK